MPEDRYPQTVKVKHLIITSIPKQLFKVKLYNSIPATECLVRIYRIQEVFAWVSVMQEVTSNLSLGQGHEQTVG